MKQQLAALLLGMAAWGVTHAADTPVYDRIAFTVSAEKEVPNDVLTAVLYAEQQGQDLSLIHIFVMWIRMSPVLKPAR